MESANKELDPCMKMAYIIAFSVISLRSSKLKYRFPFPSVLGETYELEYDQNQIKFKFIAEQISIEPNTITYNCKGQNYEVWGTMIIETNYWGKSIEIEPKGNTHVKLNLDTHFIFTNSYKLKISNLENEVPQIDLEGDINFENVETKDKGEITFRKESLVSTNYNFIGSIKNSKDEIKFKIFGIWNSTFILQNTKTKKTLELWKNNLNHSQKSQTDLDLSSFSEFSLQLNHLNLKMIEKLPLTDSRFRSDVRALELGEIKFANEEKKRIEAKQKERLLKIENRMESYKPRFFEINPKNFNNKREFVFKGTYWKIKEEEKFDEEDCDLF